MRLKHFSRAEQKSAADFCSALGGHNAVDKKSAEQSRNLPLISVFNPRWSQCGGK
jgi:hypothetical protein